MEIKVSVTVEVPDGDKCNGCQYLHVDWAKDDMKCHLFKQAQKIEWWKNQCIMKCKECKEARGMV